MIALNLSRYHYTDNIDRWKKSTKIKATPYPCSKNSYTRKSQRVALIGRKWWTGLLGCFLLFLIQKFVNKYLNKLSFSSQNQRRMLWRKCFERKTEGITAANKHFSITYHHCTLLPLKKKDWKRNNHWILIL